MPTLRARFFAPLLHKGPHGTTHLVIGTDKDAHGVSEQGQQPLLSLLQDGFVKGLKKASISGKEQLLLLTQSGQEHDTRLMCLALRALYDVGRVACLGVVDTSPSTNESMHQILHEVRAHHRRSPFSKPIKLTALVRWQVGLPHVPVLHASVGADAGGDAPPPAAAQIAKLYGDALPSGVCLVLTSAATAAASFADAHVHLPGFFHLPAISMANGKGFLRYSRTSSAPRQVV